MRIAILAALLLASPAAAAAHHPQSTATPLSAADQVATISVAPGKVAMVEADQAAEASYVGDTMRMALDMRFGPADQVVDGVAVWHAEAPGRGSCMASAGVSLATYRIDGGHAVTTVTGLRVPAMQMAAR